MGRPVLGEHVKLEVVIEESYEFKVGTVAVAVWEVSPHTVTSAPR